MGKKSVRNQQTERRGDRNESRCEKEWERQGKLKRKEAKKERKEKERNRTSRQTGDLSLSPAGTLVTSPCSLTWLSIYLCAFSLSPESLCALPVTMPVSPLVSELLHFVSGGGGRGGEGERKQWSDLCQAKKIYHHLCSEC
jgi:hypothetical protein